MGQPCARRHRARLHEALAQGKALEVAPDGSVPPECRTLHDLRRMIRFSGLAASCDAAAGESRAMQMSVLPYRSTCRLHVSGVRIGIASSSPCLM
jgi:hypothetical protein